MLTYVLTYVHKYIQTERQTYIHAYIHAYVYLYVCVRFLDTWLPHHSLSINDFSNCGSFLTQISRVFLQNATASYNALVTPTNVLYRAEATSCGDGYHSGTFKCTRSTFLNSERSMYDPETESAVTGHAFVSFSFLYLKNYTNCRNRNWSFTIILADLG